MTLKAMIKNIAVISIGGSVLLAGCSATTSLVNEEDVTIERIHSATANITRARLDSSDSTVVLRGELRRLMPGRGPIPGFLRIELIGSDGTVFKKARIGYMRKGAKSRNGRFNLTLPSELSALKAIRVIHHGGRSEMTDAQKSPWRDAKTRN